MRTKLTFLSGFATGYVLGSKAGRARYDEIRDAAQALARNPAVRSTTTTIQNQTTDALVTARGKAAGSLTEKWQERRPAWLAQAQARVGRQPAPAPSGATQGVAGSNGRL